MNKAANDSARVSGQDRKKLPALGTNQIARFGGFRPLASLEKNSVQYSLSTTLCTGSCTKLEMVNGSNLETDHELIK